MSALSDLLNSYKGDRSVRAIGRACVKYGVGVSTVTPYFNGSHGLNPPEEVLYALSMVMPLDIGRLRAAANVPRGEEEPYVAPLEANRLNYTQRKALDELIRSFTGTQASAPPQQRQQVQQSSVVDAGPELDTSAQPAALASVDRLPHDEAAPPASVITGRTDGLPTAARGGTSVGGQLRDGQDSDALAGNDIDPAAGEENQDEGTENK